MLFEFIRRLLMKLVLSIRISYITAMKYNVGIFTLSINRSHLSQTLFSVEIIFSVRLHPTNSSCKLTWKAFGCRDSNSQHLAQQCSCVNQYFLHQGSVCVEITRGKHFWMVLLIFTLLCWWQIDWHAWINLFEISTPLYQISGEKNISLWMQKHDSINRPCINSDLRHE